MCVVSICCFMIIIFFLSWKVSELNAHFIYYPGECQSCDISQPWSENGESYYSHTPKVDGKTSCICSGGGKKRTAHKKIPPGRKYAQAEIRGLQWVSRKKTVAGMYMSLFCTVAHIYCHDVYESLNFFLQTVKAHGKCSNTMTTNKNKGKKVQMSQYLKRTSCYQESFTTFTQWWYIYTIYVHSSPSGTRTMRKNVDKLISLHITFRLVVWKITVQQQTAILSLPGSFFL